MRRARKGVTGMGSLVATAESLDSPSADHGLSERDRGILAFEREWWQHPGGKEEAIRVTFGISPTRYYQILNLLIDRRVALEYDPMLVKRLLRVREDRRRARHLRMTGEISPMENNER